MNFNSIFRWGYNESPSLKNCNGKATEITALFCIAILLNNEACALFEKVNAKPRTFPAEAINLCSR